MSELTVTKHTNNANDNPDGYAWGKVYFSDGKECDYSTIAGLSATGDDSGLAVEHFLVADKHLANHGIVVPELEEAWDPDQRTVQSALSEAADGLDRINDALLEMHAILADAKANEVISANPLSLSMAAVNSVVSRRREAEADDNVEYGCMTYEDADGRCVTKRVRVREGV